MSALVTGASGFVGTWLVRRLLEQGEKVSVLQRTSSNPDFDRGQVQIRLGDITDYESVAAATQDVDTVFHLAGVVGYSRAMRPIMDKVNVGGTHNVVEALRRQKKARLVYMSSVVAIGASYDRTPLNEESPYTITNLNLGYFETKKTAEELVKAACRKGEIEAVILNPSTIYGAADAKKGSRKTQLKVAQGKFPFYTKGGVSIVSVHDVIQAVLTARERGRNGERYILSGENLTIHELFNRIAGLAGVKPPGLYLPSTVVRAIGKVGDVLEKMGKKGPLNTENAWTALLYHWFDHSKASAELGFKPRPAQEALRESVDWMKQQGLLG